MNLMPVGLIFAIKLISFIVIGITKKNH
jgi:hypothetical protein